MTVFGNAVILPPRPSYCLRIKYKFKKILFFYIYVFLTVLLSGIKKRKETLITLDMDF